MLEIGQLIDGKYKILNKIGQGGMSVVYLAMNEKANKQWAIKEVRKDGNQDFDVVKQGLVAEIDMLKKLSHPNLPSIIDVIDGDGTFLIVMDYIEGNPLDKRLKEMGAQNQDDVIEWSKQLCDVLGYLHSRKPPIIYRDMKPANVMLKPDGSVTLIDFGTAREFKDTSVADTTCLGTRGYAAPEQFGGQGQTDARTDIYCLGATMYHLLTGHNPSMYPYEMYPIRQWNPLLSSGLEEIILKCTQQNPAARYQSCAELMYALEHYQELDVENKKVQNFKWKLFLTTSMITVIMALGTVGFRSLEISETNATYDSFVKNANSQNTVEEIFSFYEDAIDLQPSTEDAYLAMLDYIEEDQVFDPTESQYVIKITGNSKYADEFRRDNPISYANFCYRLGMDYYFYYESETNSSDGVNRSANWFEKAESVEEFMNSSEYKDDARIVQIMKTLAVNDNGAKWGKRNDKTGQVEEGSGYDTYWAVIKEMTESDLAEQLSSARMAIKVYGRFAVAINTNAQSFLKAGLSEDVIIRQLETMKEYIQPENLLKYDSFDASEDDLLVNSTIAKIDEAIAQVHKANQSLSNDDSVTEVGVGEEAVE